MKGHGLNGTDCAGDGARKLTRKPIRERLKQVQRRGHAAKLCMAVSPVFLAGCVTVNAPEEPIVIELNLNITQEVIVRLAEDANNTIEENADIF
jgi:hypothetical protein